jgi:hypothetical protein
LDWGVRTLDRLSAGTGPEPTRPFADPLGDPLNGHSATPRYSGRARNRRRPARFRNHRPRWLRAVPWYLRFFGRPVETSYPEWVRYRSRPASDILVVDHWKSVDIETDFQAAISPCKADILAPTASTASGPSSRCVGGVALSTRVRMARAAMRGSPFCLPLRAARAARMGSNMSS